VRILVVGDSYCPSSAFRAAFLGLESAHEVEYIDVADEPSWAPSSPSELKLREFTGTPQQVAVGLDGQEVLVVQGAAISDAVIAADPALRLICCARGGPVNIDLVAASERGIPVVTTPGKNADAVAELAICLMVMLARRLPEAIRHIDTGAAVFHDNYEGGAWFGHDLAGHVLGLVGFGQIGRRVASRARAFGMQVIAFDPYLADKDIGADGVEPCDLSALLGRSDFVSLHARLTPENRGLLGAAEFGAMGRGSYLVNTARRELIDERALIDALASGRLAGAGLDIATPSPTSGRHPLLAFPNVVLVPHIGGATYETLHHGSEMAAAEIKRFAAGEPLVNVANRADLSATPVLR
jgi:D-3-phosphoglycerate dehydrogenase